MFSVSVILVDLDLSIDLTLSVLFLLGVSTVLLDACGFSVMLTVSFFFPEIGGVMDSFTTLGFFSFFFVYHVSMPFLKTVSVVITNAFLVSSKSPLFFLTFSLGLSDYLGNGSMILDYMISLIDILHPVNSRISSIF